MKRMLLSAAEGTTRLIGLLWARVDAMSGVPMFVLGVPGCAATAVSSSSTGAVDRRIFEV